MSNWIAVCAEGGLLPLAATTSSCWTYFMEPVTYVAPPITMRCARGSGPNAPFTPVPRFLQLVAGRKNVDAVPGGNCPVGWVLNSVRMCEQRTCPFKFPSGHALATLDVPGPISGSRLRYCTPA